MTSAEEQLKLFKDLKYPARKIVLPGSLFVVVLPQPHNDANPLRSASFREHLRKKPGLGVSNPKLIEVFHGDVGVLITMNNDERDPKFSSFSDSSLVCVRGHVGWLLDCRIEKL